MTGATWETPVDPVAVPASLEPLVQGMTWARNVVGEAGAAVHRLHAAGRSTLFLKHGHGAISDQIAAEMIRMRWLARHTPVPVMLGFVATPEEAWLLMSEVPGRSAYEILEAEPEARLTVVTALAGHLRALHGLPVDECPFNSTHPLRFASARRRIDAGTVDEDDFDDDHEGWTAERVWLELIGMLPIETDRVVTHGDYSLDNVMIEGGRVTGLIDLGRAGIADRYQDLAILWNCLGEFGDDLQAHLLAAYGVGMPDVRKIRFHLALDEFF